MSIKQEIIWNIKLGDFKWVFIEIYRYSRCLVGWHKWSSWSAYVLCNVQQCNENPQKCLTKDGMAISERRCDYCQKPMLLSRQGEKNYKDYEY